MTDQSSSPAHKGVILKESRESRRISLETVHEATKIPMDALRAIEEGYTVRSLSSFYYKGFIKMYAQYLGVDAREVIEETSAVAERKKPEPVKIKREITFDKDLNKKDEAFFTEQRVKQAIAIVGVLLAFIVIIKGFGEVKNFITARPQKPKIERIEKPKLKIIPKKIEAQEKKRSPAKAVKPAVRPAEVKSSAAAPAPAPMAGAPAESNPPPAAALDHVIAAPSSDKVSLTVRATRSTWLQVKTDGMVVFQSTLNKGAVESWNAKDKIEISGKNVNELELELNGKVIGSLGRADSLARKLIITKDGLTVKK